MRDAPEIFHRIYDRHGHRCPMSTLGGRLALAALDSLPKAEDDLRAEFQMRTCAIDGIAEITGCNEEDGTLSVRHTGRHLLTLFSESSEVAVELTPHALTLAGRYRTLCNRLEQNWETLSSSEQARRRRAMERLLDTLLPQLWEGDQSELVHIVGGAHG